MVLLLPFHFHFPFIDAERTGKKGIFQEGDISSVINELGPNDITQLFGSLGLKEIYISRKKNTQRSNVQIKAKRVLVGWLNMEKPRPSTIDDLLKALERAGNKNASQELQLEWGICKYSGIVTNFKYFTSSVHCSLTSYLLLYFLFMMKGIYKTCTEILQMFSCREISSMIAKRNGDNYK